MNGPFVIVCRGHSGGRVVSEAFVRNGIQMGELNPATKDTKYFAPRRNPLIRELTLLAFDYAGMDEEAKRRMQCNMQRVVENFVAQQIADRQKPFGWKFGETLFLTPLILDAIPTTKLLHVIRDGRDVMLSRLRSRFKNLTDDPLNKLLVFGDKKVESFHGVPLDALDLESVRNELEMTHWVTSVRFGLGLRTYGDRYLEVRYEDICRHPVRSFDEIFTFLGVPLREDVREWLGTTVQTDRIGKWKKYPPGQLREPMRIGASLLQELGYDD